MTASSRITREELIEQQSRLWGQALAKADAEHQQLASEIYEKFGKDIEKTLNESTKANLKTYLTSLPENFPESWPIGQAKKLLKQREYVRLVIEVCINYAQCAQALQEHRDGIAEHFEKVAGVERDVSNIGKQLKAKRKILRKAYAPSKHYSDEAYPDIPERITEEELACVDALIDKAIQWYEYDWHLQALTTPGEKEPQKDRGRPELVVRNQAIERIGEVLRCAGLSRKKSAEVIHTLLNHHGFRVHKPGSVEQKLKQIEDGKR